MSSSGVLDSQHNTGRGDVLFAFTQGIDVDRRLARSEVRVQKAWARALARLGVLSSEELSQLEPALDEALALMESGKFEWRVRDEDIHMNLERFVTDKVGALGKKMHSGRSRNDLIATTLRLHAHEQLGLAVERLGDLVAALVERAGKDLDVLVPGLTHLQHGQPVRHGHALAAHGWAFARDLSRLNASRARALESMPLGSAALGGTAVAVDLAELARDLGFARPSWNSYDSVGDRDFLLEAIDALAQCGVHLSRFAEDCVYWSSTAVGLVRLPPEWSTGSSIMPNKRNPDVPELTRGKAAHLMACATNAHVLMKSVPTSYGSDLHELKSVFMRAADELFAVLTVLPSFTRGLEPNRERAAELLRRGHVLATELADELAARGVPFREAYAQVAALVKLAESRGVQVEELPAAEARKTAPALPAEFLAKLSAESAVERRQGQGGTSLARAREGIQALERELKALLASQGRKS